MKHLIVDHVTTELGKKILINDISFEIKRGEVLALVGHNGAGKSTLMKTIMKMLDKKSGQIMIQEQYDQDEHLLMFKKHISYLPEEPLLLTELTVMQHFQMYAMSYDIKKDVFEKKVKKLVDGFDLNTKLDAYPEELSKGMRQKVQAICALLPEVPVLLIDEPFMGLDIYAVDYLKELIEEKIEAGASLLLTSHQLNQVKELADRFILLRDGEVEREGPIEQFETISRGLDHA